MLPTTLATFFGISNTAMGMSSAGIVVFVIAAWATHREFAATRGLDRIVALRTASVAIPIAVFGALHFFGPSFVTNIVPRYMPWRMCWVYGVGAALIGASLSLATDTAVRWSGLLFGIMMFLFVAMIHLPGAVRQPNRFIWVIVFRELSFGGAGWILAAHAMNDARGTRVVRGVGIVLITTAAIIFGVEHFLHPTGMPGVPLPKQMPAWVPGPILIGYVTGAALLATGGSVLLRRHVRTVAACAAAWLLLMILVIYAPVLVMALSDPGVNVQVEGINYFADTLLFTGALLALASAAERPVPSVDAPAALARTHER